MPGFEGTLRLDRCEACEQEAQTRARNERRQRDAGERRAGAGIPVRYHGLKLSDLATWPLELVMACDAWAKQEGGLYIHGPVGTGKTTAAAAAAWQLLDRRPVRWVRASQLGRWALASFGSPEHDAAQKIAGGTQALVVDDFGEEPTSDTVATVLKDAIQSRIDAGAPLLVTSNLDVGSACERTEMYGQRTASRLAEYCHQVMTTGRDHRLDRKPPSP